MTWEEIKYLLFEGTDDFGIIMVAAFALFVLIIIVGVIAMVLSPKEQILEYENRCKATQELALLLEQLRMEKQNHESNCSIHYNTRSNNNCKHTAKQSGNRKGGKQNGMDKRKPVSVPKRKG